MKQPIVMFEFESLDGLKRRQNMGRISPQNIHREYHLPIMNSPTFATDLERPRNAQDYMNVSRRIYDLVSINQSEPNLVVARYKERRGIL